MKNENNRLTLEKKFVELKKYDFIEYEENGLDASYSVVNMDKIKRFIFDTLLEDVLESVVPERFSIDTNMRNIGYNDCIYEIKIKAKELYNINL